MTRKNTNKSQQQPALRFQPYYKSNTPPPADHSAWLSSLTASLASIQPNRILHVDLDATKPVTAIPTVPSPLTPPRYTCIIIDHNPAFSHVTSSSSPSPPSSSALPSCAALIISPGREVEYLFSQPEGQLSLIRQHSFNRLILISLNRTHHFTSLAAVQAELRPYITSLLPLQRAAEVPFLALSAELGERREVEVVDSAANGEVVVEDLKVDGEWIRRLLFARSGNVQSEARLLSLNPPCIDFGLLHCLYQRAFISALSLLPSTPSSILLIGLGAGSLPMFLTRCFPLASITIVEIDDEVVRFASSYFGFTLHPRMKLLVEDGLTFLSSDSSTYDLTVIDCNSRDLSEGLSFPPPSFLHPDLLRHLHQLLSTPGLFLLNFGCRSHSKRQQTLSDFLDVWGTEVYEADVDEDDVNTVLVGRKGGGEETRAEIRRRGLTKGRIEEERRRAREAGVEVGEFRLHEEMRVREGVDAIYSIRREEGGKIERQLLPEGETAGEGEEEEVEEGVTMSAEERKRAKARAKKAKQKAKKKGS